MADFPLPFLLFGGFVALAIVLGIIAHRQEKKRQEVLAQFALARQWYFEPNKVRGFDAKYLDFDFLDRGTNRYAHNILAGSHRDCVIEAFDYHYETHSTDSKGRRQTHHHRFSVAILESPFPLRQMVVRPEGIFDKLSAAFGWDDIDFESAEFSRRYHVSSPDRRWAYDVIHQRTMEHLLACPAYELHFAGRHLAIKGPGRFEPWEFAKAIDMGATVLHGIPEFARRPA
jgi:hypothetical protein